MPTETSRLRRPALSIVYPQSWWDYIFIHLAGVTERFSTNRVFRVLSILPSVLFRVLVWGVSPAAQPNFEHRPNWKRILIVAIGAAIATLCFSFGLNYLFAGAADTLSGSDPRRIYYWNDRHNIRIYTIIAPIYIACASVIIYVYLTSSLFMRRFDEHLSSWEMSLLTLQLAAFVLLALGIDAFVQYRYYNEIVTDYDKLKYSTEWQLKNCPRKTFWFAERGASNQLTLNISGMFYFIGNFVRFGIVIAAVFCFVGASASLVRLGVRIAPGAGTYDIAGLREKLYLFSIIELWTKGLYFILNIHAKVWGIPA